MLIKQKMMKNIRPNNKISFEDIFLWLQARIYKNFNFSYNIYLLLL